MEFLELKAKVRTTTGNGPARALRRSGRVPAVLYGPDSEPVLLSLNAADFDLSLRSQSGQLLFNLTIESKEGGTRSAMLKELQSHPVSRQLLHADFYEVSMDRKLRVRVPVKTIGKSKGVEFGGMLQIVRHELEVLCLPSEIPEAITIDISDMDIGDSFHIEEIPLADGVEIPSEVNFTVLTILSPTKKDEDEEEALEEGEIMDEEEAEVGDEVS